MSNYFNASQFTLTQFTSAEQKAEFANSLVKFILNGFKSNDFTPALYKNLSNSFGHLAHYDIRGFYNAWFSTASQARLWFDRIQQYTPVGSESHTFSDVERQFKSWFTLHFKEVADAIVKYSEEQEKIAELAGTKQTFRIAAISSNTGAFGHRRHILVSKYGVACEADRQPNYHNPSNQDFTSGQDLVFTVNSEGMPIDYHAHGFETLSRMLPDPPTSVIKEIFNDHQRISNGETS